MSNPSWCNNCEECNLIYHRCYVPYIDSNYEYCEHCNVEEYRFNNDEGYRCKIFEKALTLACKELSYRDSPTDCKHVSAPRTVRYKDEFLKEAREIND